jgi:hypothetical protein
MTVSLPLLVTWYATGNNVAIGADTARRTLQIRLETPLEKPEERQGFRYANLLEHIRQHRGELVIACCTILKAYFDAGKPKQSLPAWGSFEEWSQIVRNALVWAGQADPAETRTVLAEQSDTETSALRLLLAAWQGMDPQGRGLTVSEAVSMATRRNIDDIAQIRYEFPTAQQAFADLFGHATNKPASTRAIGRRLAQWLRRIVDGRMFDSRNNRQGIKEWFVRPATSCSQGLPGLQGLFDEADEGLENELVE